MKRNVFLLSVVILAVILSSCFLLAKTVTTEITSLPASFTFEGVRGMDTSAVSTSFSFCPPELSSSSSFTTDEGSPLTTTVTAKDLKGTFDSEYTINDLKVTAQSTAFTIRKTSQSTDTITYEMTPGSSEICGTFPVTFIATDPDGLSGVLEKDVVVNRMTNLSVSVMNMAIGHPTGNDATVTGHGWGPGAYQRVKVYRVPVESVNSSPETITADPSGSTLVYEGYTDENGNLNVKLKSFEMQDAMYRIVDTRINEEGEQVSYGTRQWFDGESDGSVTLVTTDYDEWFMNFFSAVSIANTSLKLIINGTTYWPKNLEDHVPIYIFTGRPWSASPTTRVMNYYIRE